MKITKKLKINKDHIVKSPIFHDGILKKIEILDDNNLDISIKTTNKKIYNVIFYNIEYLNINNFKIGNIILDIEIWQLCDCSTNFLKKILENDQNIEYFTQILEKIKLDKLSLIIINPSYGAELVCICESFTCNYDL